MSLMALIDNFFQTRGFMPHGMCLLWRPSVLWMMVAGNGIIAFSYFMIPVALIYLILKRRDIGFKWIFVLFGAFILACGITHIMSIVILWKPVYGLEALILVITGIISLITAVLLWPLLPILFKIPSPWLLEQLNTTLRKNNEELAKAELAKSKLAAIVENTDDAIISKSLDGIIVSWNVGAQRLYGYTQKEIIGKPISLLIPENHLKEYYQSMEQINKGNSIKLLDTERKHKDGHLIPVSVTISPIRDNNAEIIGDCTIARDITEWKQIQKMKNEFISVVSHELRTPLTSVQGALSLLVSGSVGPLPEKAINLLQIGKQNTERLIRLINDILDIEKIEAGKMEFKFEHFAIDMLVKESIISNQAFADKLEIKIKLIQETSLLVNVDRDRLLQVLANLLSNAIKFAYPKSEILISITQVDKNVKVAITNQGAGIPKEFRVHIFEKFTQADSSQTREQKGTGLGLSISKEIIERLNGTIGFESEPNKETTFFFELPIVGKLPEVQKYYEKKPCILICQDDIKTSNYLKAFLEGNGFKVIITSTAQDAKKVLSEQQVDTLLLDLMLPDEDGIAFIKELRNTKTIVDLPIIVISLIAEKGKHELNGNAFSILDWIEKPVDLDRLMTSIQLIIKQSKKKAPTVLHIEDDTDLIQVVGHLLQNDANVISTTSLKEAKIELDKTNFDLVILDLMLPDGSGVELIPIISKKHIPIIVFTAYELPKDYSPYVIKILMKSRTSQNAFLETIESSLFGKKMNKFEK